MKTWYIISSTIWRLCNFRTST